MTVNHQIQLEEISAAALAVLGRDSRTLVYAAVVTDDGLEVAHFPAPPSGEGWIAALASSIQALAGQASAELGIGESRYAIVGADGGFIVQLKVPDRPLVIAAQFDNSESVGTALALAKLATDRLALALAAQ